MKRVVVLKSFVLILMMLLIAAGCKTDEETAGITEVTGIKLGMNGLTLPFNGEKTITAALTPEKPDNKRIRWYSSDPTVAYVDGNGHVMAISEGTAVITAYPSNPNLSDTCIVAVMGPYQEGDPNGPFMQMVKIDGGSFAMGSPGNEPNRREDENMRTGGNVTVGAFRMGKYQVTQKQYLEVMGNNPGIFRGKSLPDEVISGDNLPVESVSWYHAIIFCNKLSIQEGLDPVYFLPGIESLNPDNWGEIPTKNTDARWDAVKIIPEANGYRLPTEAQWEYACRAGTTTMYWTGNTELSITGKGNVADLACLEIDLYAYWNGIGNWTVINIYDGFSEIAPVGSFAPNAFGLYDMLGNVWEWCWDWYTESYNNAGGTVDPHGAGSGISRVMRGGSWGGYGEYLRTAYRLYTAPYHTGDVIGFRVARNYP